MPDDPARLSPADIVALARGWIGTPYVGGAALRGAGCDCIGLVRGIHAEATGRPPPPVPGWRADWAGSRARPLLAAARDYLIEVEPPASGLGAVVVLRDAWGHAAHAGILANGAAGAGRPTLIHAIERRGVVEVPLPASRIVFAGRFRFVVDPAPTEPPTEKG